VELGFFIVIILLFLATLDLAVGVSNDAVNFINSAYGSNAARLKTILFISAIGVFVGVLCSGGMLEVARKGVFYPQQFMLMELLVIFLAVMIGDILLLDIFNSYGMPTSTTVSIVFGLAGAAVSMAVIKLGDSGQSLNYLSEYINLKNIGKIASGIFLSIVIAFISGAVIQYITRLVFTFNYKERFRKYGSIWGSIVISVLSAFIIFKGTKNADFIPEHITHWLKENIALFIGIMFVFWVIVLQILIRYTKTNILKGIVLFGTFALAMAFAANDLVNFIGAPIAGLNAFDLSDGGIGEGGFFANLINAFRNGTLNADMAGLGKKVPVNMMLLLVSAAVMIITLFTSKKAMRVARTGIDLGKQGDIAEKFETNVFGRFLVKLALDVFKVIKVIVPDKTAEWIRSRFDLSEYKPELDENGQEPAFDLIRATVILFVSAALITVATSMKLPLSTTYVTFITAMAAALPDKAWDRESAAYRVSGVISVVMGWFMTALFAFLIEFVLVIAIQKGGLWAIIPLLALIILIIIRSNRRAKKQIAEEDELARKISQRTKGTKTDTYAGVIEDVTKFIKTSAETLCISNKGLVNSNIDKLKSSKKMAKSVESQSNIIRRNVLKMMGGFEEGNPEADFLLSRAMVNIQDIEDRVAGMAKANYKYINNQHDDLLPEQAKELNEIGKLINEIFVNAAEQISSGNFDLTQNFKDEVKVLKKKVKAFNENQINRLKGTRGKMRRSMLYMNLLFETRALCDDVLYLYSNIKKVSKFDIED
jgi:phosphate/sulfate permease